MEQHLLPPDLEDRFRRDVEECGLAEIWPRLRAVAPPCYAVELVPDDDLEQLGTSRLGGLPDLPSRWAWPERDGQLLTFIGQVSLAEVPRLSVPLPERGMLCFFLGVDEPASNIDHEVLFWDGPDQQLHRHEEPDESAFVNEDCTTFRPAGVRFVPSVSLPSFCGDPSMRQFLDQVEDLRERMGSPSSRRKPSPPAPIAAGELISVVTYPKPIQKMDEGDGFKEYLSGRVEVYDHFILISGSSGQSGGEKAVIPHGWYKNLRFK